MVAATPTPNNHHCPHNMSVLEKEQDASTKCTSPTKSSTKSSMKSSTNNSNNNNNNNKDDNKDDNANKIAKKNNKNNSKKRRVQFFPKCFVKHTISRHDMTDKEIQATWIQQNEEKAIRRRCQQLIKNASGHNSNSDNSNSDSDNSDDESMRGLEDIKQRRWNRQIAQDEVFDEQDRQDIDYDYNKGRGYNYNNAGLNDTNNNNNDDERIASVYKEYTLKCTISARIMAIKDRNDIENYIMVLQH